MERRSRSQTRRPGDPPPPLTSSSSAAGRHASSSRLTGQGAEQPLSLPYSRPPEQARTLSPDRRDRYRASYREAAHNGHPPTISNSVPHSNSNSYNQYNQAYPLNPSRYGPPGEVPPPRPLPPSSLNYNNNTSAPPRPEPPSGYAPSTSQASPSKSPEKVIPPSHQVQRLLCHPQPKGVSLLRLFPLKTSESSH